MTPTFQIKNARNECLAVALLHHAVSLLLFRTKNQRLAECGNITVPSLLRTFGFPHLTGSTSYWCPSTRLHASGVARGFFRVCVLNTSRNAIIENSCLNAETSRRGGTVTKPAPAKLPVLEREAAFIAPCTPRGCCPYLTEAVDSYAAG